MIAKSCNILMLSGHNAGIFVAIQYYVKQFKKEILREALTICKQSGLYYVFTSKEKREAIIHVYNLIHETRIIKREASGRSV